MDGDLRYNFNKNLVYLEKVTSDNCFADELIGSRFFTNIKQNLNEGNRNNRKLYASEIVDK